MSPRHGDARRALAVVREQLAEAVAVEKCHACGCLHELVVALSASPAAADLADGLRAARDGLEPKRYDCLGCSLCYPAVAANAFAEAFPEVRAGLDLCPTEAADERPGWPPLAGAYQVVRYRAPVAVCALRSGTLATRLAERAPDGLAITGTMQTENLGIERLIRNVLANPHIRFLLLCGEDTPQAIGHVPGQALESLFAGGLDDRGRIRGARGKRPILMNVSREQVALFRRQVELVSMIGTTEEDRIVEIIAGCAAQGAPPFAEAVPEGAPAAIVAAEEPRRLLPDPAGFFVIYPDRRAHRLVAEHYSTAGVLDCVIEGRAPATVYAAIVARSLVSRLDHAAYLGQELARAERTLATGEPYVQDRAAGEIEHGAESVGCGCSGKQGCGGPS
jgi:tetrahydromethanopterin S-methyltransferase subunit A